MSSENGEHDYTAHYTKNEIEERREKGELEVHPDSLVMPAANTRILKYLERGDDGGDSELAQRIHEEGVLSSMRKAVAKDDRAAMAAFRGFKQAQRGEDELTMYLVNNLRQEAMTIYHAATTNTGKTHLLLLECNLAVSRLCDYEAFITNVPLEAETEGTMLEVGGGFTEHEGLAVPARWDMTGQVPELEWQANSDLVKVFLDWHVRSGLPLTEVVATTEQHARAVAEYIDGRVFIGVDEYGTSGGGWKGDGGGDRPTVNFVRAIRKDPWNASIAFIGHSPTDLPPDLRRLVKLGVEKDERATATFYEQVTQSGFEDQVGPPFQVPGHRLDDYNDKVQPPWKFKPRDGDEEDGDSGQEAAEELPEDQLVAWGKTIYEDRGSFAKVSEAEEYPRSGEWLRQRINGD